MSSPASQSLLSKVALGFCAILLVSSGNGPVKAMNTEGRFVYRGREYNIQTAAKNPIVNDDKIIVFNGGPGLFWKNDQKKDRIRSELQSRQTIAVGGSAVVKYSVKVIAAPSIKSDSLVLGQFHATPDPGDFQGYPVFELNLSQSGLAIYTSSVSAAHHSAPYSRTLRASNIPFSLSKWHEVSVAITPSYIDRGRLCVKIDDVVRFCQSGISVGMNDTVGPYWKFGLYYMPASASMHLTVSYRNFALSGEFV